MKENEKFGSWTVINETFELNPKPKGRKNKTAYKRMNQAARMFADALKDSEQVIDNVDQYALNVKIDTINVKENN